MKIRNVILIYFLLFFSLIGKSQDKVPIKLNKGHWILSSRIDRSKIFSTDTLVFDDMSNKCFADGLINPFIIFQTDGKFQFLYDRNPIYDSNGKVSSNNSKIAHGEWKLLTDNNLLTLNFKTKNKQKDFNKTYTIFKIAEQLVLIRKD